MTVPLGMAVAHMKEQMRSELQRVREDLAKAASAVNSVDQQLESGAAVHAGFLEQQLVIAAYRVDCARWVLRTLTLAEKELRETAPLGDKERA